MRPTRPSSDDEAWIRRALDLAQAMRGHVWPNPPVGCVIVKDGLVVAEAATQPGGRPHAERKALELAGPEAEGATLYVTLEPCCHWGKTPPCADAIVDAGVSRVVCAIRDPDPRVNGGGFAKLRGAGLDVSVGLCAAEAERLMSGFFHRVRHGEPEIVVMNHDTATEVPAGVDALILSSPHGPRLVARPGEIDVSGVERHRLLSRMGEVGLTSVAVQSHDLLLSALSPSAPD
ncbi:MAG: bifunctional diaminohydroxyphosphoribosylaminopyrimidine deaminase/5-amino-6-(5-phosphoribosylamino)uracil reductase RibD [Pseudomonadota bacterium]